MKKTVDITRSSSVIIEGDPLIVPLAEELLSMGAALRSMYLDWTIDDENEGDCDNSGSGADVAAQVFAILARHGYKVN